jgi:hypothetical protein
MILTRRHLATHQWVARNYLTGSFVFDLCTSIPISFVELSLKLACDEAAAGDTSIDGSQLLAEC